MKRIIMLVFLFFPFIAYTAEKTVRIAAASNLSFVLEELKLDFEKTHPGVALEITYGASGKFATQIEQGATYDIFMSADMKFPGKIAEDGFAGTEPKVYANGKLIIFTVKKIDLKAGLDILKNESIKTVSLCNPETAPYGQAAVEVLKNYGIFPEVESKLVRTETVAQVIQQVITASDIGFTAESLTFSRDMAGYKEGINWVEVDPRLYTGIKQGIIILKKAVNKPGVRSFYEYIFSKNARLIFRKYRYDN